MKLQRDQKRFHRAHRQQRRRENQWQPERGVNPERRLVFDLHDQSGGDDDGAGQHDEENRRAIAAVDEGVIEPADLAVRPQMEEARIELALAAARAAAGDAAQRALGQGVYFIIHVSSFPSPLVGEGSGTRVPDAMRHHKRVNARLRRTMVTPRRAGTYTDGPETKTGRPSGPPPL